MVQNLESFEFANPIFGSILDHKRIANIQITASETVGVETRAEYYDRAGAIRDMVQNHLLQLVMMTALHLPEKMTAEEIRKQKVTIMESLRPIYIENIARDIVRGQYQAGEIFVTGLASSASASPPNCASSSRWVRSSRCRQPSPGQRSSHARCSSPPAADRVGSVGRVAGPTRPGQKLFSRHGQPRREARAARGHGRGMGSLVGLGPGPERGSATTAEEGDDQARDHVRRGARCRAVLRVDRWAVAIP